MTDLILLLFAGFVIGITGAMIPGPLTFFTVSEALKNDKHAGLKAITGHILLEFLIIIFIFFGFHKFFTNERFLMYIYVIGGLALMAMGIILIVNSRNLKLVSKKSGPVFSKGLFIGGFFFSAISAGFLVWWATIGVSTIVRALLFGIIGVVLLAIGHWIADALWYWFLSYAVDRGKKYLTDSSYQNLVRIFSVFLILLGAYFIALIRNGIV